VLWMYGNLPGWNHPPLTGYLAAGLLQLAYVAGLRFPVVFKLAPMAADAVCLVLLWKIWRRRSSRPAAALAAVAIFSFSPDAILVSAYHGNNDPLVGLFVLAACYFIEEETRFVLAGLALAAAVNVKLIPLILVPVFLANVRRWPEAARFIGGLSVGAVPFIPVLLRTGTAFYRNAIAYNSNFDNWGISFFIREGEQNPDWARVAVHLHAVFISTGRYVVVATILALCAWSRWRRPLSTYQLAAGGLAAFLVLAPGFGVQYTAILGPVLVAASLGWGLWYALSAGVFLMSVYYLFWTREALLASIFTTPFPYPSSWIGLVAWAGLALFLLSLAQARPPRGERLAGEPPPARLL
jgi:Glycosyltransferase family 87